MSLLKVQIYFAFLIFAMFKVEMNLQKKYPSRLAHYEIRGLLEEREEQRKERKLNEYFDKES
jgi:hypothetical protein